MSEARDIIRDTIADRQDFTGDAIENLRTGTKFTAELEDVQDIELNTALGRDARESILVHINDRIVSAEIRIGDKLRCVIYGITVLLDVLRRKDNPTDPQVEFGCAKVVPGIDQ